VLDDERLRHLLQRAENQARPEPEFLDELFADLRQRRKRRFLGMWGLRLARPVGAFAAFVSLALVVGVGVVLFALNQGSHDQGVGAAPSAAGASASAAVSSSHQPTTPSPTPAASPIDVATWTSYASARYGLTMRYPSDWTAIAGTAPWPVGTPHGGGIDASMDAFSPNPGAEPTLWFNVTSQPLPAGTTAQDWLAADYAASPGTPHCFPSPAAREQVTIGGKTGWINGGQAGCGFIEADVFTGGRVYVLFSSFTDRTLFNAFASTVTLHPSQADDKSVN